MIKSRFSHLKLSALIAVFAMTLVPYPRTSAGSRLSPIVTGADLGNEQRIIAKYAADLVAYDKQTQALGKRARLVSSDLDEVEIHHSGHYFSTPNSTTTASAARPIKR